MYKPHKLTEGLYVRQKQSIFADWGIEDDLYLRSIGKIIRVAGPRFRTDPPTGAPLDLVQVEWIHPTPHPQFKKTWTKAEHLKTLSPLVALAVIAAENETGLTQ